MKNVDLLLLVARDLDSVAVDAVFFGGTVVGLHLDALPPGDEERPTTDVDCVPIAVETPADMRGLEARLDRSGWRHDMTGRNRNAFGRISPSGVPVDFVPVHTMHDDDPVRCGRHVQTQVGDQRLTVLSAPAMLAAKLAAFRDRGRSDPLMSHDLEDAAMLVACCSRVESELPLEPHTLRASLQVALLRLLEDRYVLEVLEGSVPRGVDSAGVIARLKRLATG